MTGGDTGFRRRLLGIVTDDVEVVLDVTMGSVETVPVEIMIEVLDIDRVGVVEFFLLCKLLRGIVLK